MIKKYRDEFNANFTIEAYQHLLEELAAGFAPIPFRVAETPVFIPDELREKLIAAGEEIIALIKQDNFKALTQQAIPAQWHVPNESKYPHFLTFDYGLCTDEQGEITPMLIEMQGFPSLYGFQSHLAKTYKKCYHLNTTLTPYSNGLTATSYHLLLKKVILGPYLPHEVALMDVDVLEQKTAIDFLVTAKELGIKILSVTEIKKSGKQLYYEENGQKIILKRIYNRLIFDEVANDLAIFEGSFDPREELDIEWITHPNWFYRISKYTLPLLKSKFVPETYYLNQLENIPSDLENYVLKPLFSFAGMGVLIDVTQQDIEVIKDPENWILQRKVHYAPVIQSPTGAVKVEIRMMYLWPPGEEPQLCINLARLSKGKMIGVRYNAEFDWVGGAVGFWETATSTR